MKKLTVAGAIACAVAGLVLANPPERASKNQDVVETFTQFAQHHGDVLVAADVEALDKILADDWLAIGLSGKTVTKEVALENLKNGKHKLESFELGPIDAQVIGNFAAVHGSAIEKRRWDGKDDSGQFMWMDLLEKRGDRWVIIRSAGVRVR